MTTTRGGVRYALYQCPECRLDVDYGGGRVSCGRRRCWAVDTSLRRDVGGYPGAAGGSRGGPHAADADHQGRDCDRGIQGLGSLQGAAVGDHFNASASSCRRPWRTSRSGWLSRLCWSKGQTCSGGGRVTFNEAVSARQEAAERFSALDLDRKREIIRALLRVTVAPSTRPRQPPGSGSRSRGWTRCSASRRKVTSTLPRPSAKLLPPELASERFLRPSLLIPPVSSRDSDSRQAGLQDAIPREPAHRVRRVPGGNGHPRRPTGRSRVGIGKRTRALQWGRATLLSGEADPGDRLSLKGSVDLARATCTARDGWFLSLRPWGRE
jgi:hypothetical protein